MKRLQEETMCKMAVLGRGSMKDRKKVCIFSLYLFVLSAIYINLLIDGFCLGGRVACIFGSQVRTLK